MALDLTVAFPFDAWAPVADVATRTAAVDAVERGKVLHLPRLRFEVQPEEPLARDELLAVEVLLALEVRLRGA
jgi:hypothetical protein